MEQSNANQQLKDMSHQLGKNLGSTIQKMMHATDGANSSISEIIKQHPLKSVALATALGIIIGGVFTKSFTNNESDPR